MSAKLAHSNMETSLRAPGQLLDVRDCFSLSQVFIERQLCPSASGDGHSLGET